MSVRNYLGRANIQTQRHKITFADTTNTSTFILTLTNGNSTVTDVETWTNGGAETATTISAGIAALIEKSTNGLFARLSVEDATLGVIHIQSKYAGEPFSLAITGTGTAPVVVVENENGHPLDFNCESNWAEGAVAVSGDDIIFHASVGYNLNQSAITFGKISTSHSFAGDIGYSGTPFAGGCTDLDIYGRGRGYFDVGSSAITPIVHSTAQVPAGEFAFTIKGSALTSLTVRGGSATMAPYQGQTSSCTTVYVEGGRYFAGSGLTNTTTNQTGGDVELWHAATTINAYSGERTQIMGAGAITTLRVGNVPNNNVDTSGTITNLESLGSFDVNMTRSRVARTVTNPKVYGSGNIVADTAVVTFSNAAVGRTDGVVNALGLQA